MKLIDKAAVVEEIEKLISNGQVKLQEAQECNDDESYVAWSEHIATCIKILSFLDTLEVKEVDEQKERMSECPYRKVGCTMYEDTILECNGACSWVVDFPKLKELKAQKGEEV